MRRLVLLAALECSLGSCKASQETPMEAPTVDAWPDARTRRIAVLAGPDGERTLELGHEPSAPDPSAFARLSLVLASPGKKDTLWSEAVPLAQRDALWKTDFLVVREPSPGERLGVSTDGGASFRLVLALGAIGPVFCPHLKLSGISGAPDWLKAPSLEAWAAAVLETAVWGCDAQGRHCKHRSLAGLDSHHSEPGGEDLLPRFHDEELGPALAFAEGRKLDRKLASALVDAALTYQRVLDGPGLLRLGAAGAKALASDGPLSPGERKALHLRALLARDEAKKLPPAQLSPRESIAALLEGLNTPDVAAITGSVK
jgi:hypothetical protein